MPDPIPIVKRAKGIMYFFHIFEWVWTGNSATFGRLKPMEEKMMSLDSVGCVKASISCWTALRMANNSLIEERISLSLTASCENNSCSFSSDNSPSRKEIRSCSDSDDKCKLLIFTAPEK